MKGDAGLRPLRVAVGEWSPGRGIAGDPLHAIAAGWAGIVGPGVAAHCAPLEISGKTLVIVTKSSAWSQQLHFLGDTILAGIRTLHGERGIERLAFRVGVVRRRDAAAKRGAPAGRRIRRAGPAAAMEPALDLESAFERLREHMRTTRAAAGKGCAACGASIEAPRPERLCAPCAGRDATDRALVLERMIYMAPWLTLAELHEALPGLSGSEFEHARRRLLQRWWLLLERARRAGRLSTSGIERPVASSYVLLQSRLPPDRISPAVVRNLLGDGLEALLWPSARAASDVGPAGAFVE